MPRIPVAAVIVSAVVSMMAATRVVAMMTAAAAVTLAFAVIVTVGAARATRTAIRLIALRAFRT